ELDDLDVVAVGILGGGEPAAVPVLQGRDPGGAVLVHAGGHGPGVVDVEVVDDSGGVGGLGPDVVAAVDHQVEGAKTQHLVAVHLAVLVGPQHGDVPVAQAVGLLAGQEHAVECGSTHDFLLVSVVDLSVSTDPVAAVNSSARSVFSSCVVGASRNRTR